MEAASGQSGETEIGGVRIGAEDESHQRHSHVAPTSLSGLGFCKACVKNAVELRFLKVEYAICTTFCVLFSLVIYGLATRAVFSIFVPTT